MAHKSFATGMLDALGYSLQTDPSVAVIGAWSFIMDRGLPPEQEKAFFEKYGERLIDPPTSEGVIAAMATGAAVCGMRPFVNFGTSSFSFEAWNQMINETGNAHFAFLVTTPQVNTRARVLSADACWSCFSPESSSELYSPLK